MYVLWYYHLIAVYKFYGIDLGQDYIWTLFMYSRPGLGHFHLRTWSLLLKIVTIELILILNFKFNEKNSKKIILNI